jgi:hypothetical protein
MATIQEQMKGLLEKTGLPYKAIEVYGSQIVVTTVSLDSANRWVAVLSKFCRVRGITNSVDEKADSSPAGRKYTKVRRVFAVVNA